MHKLLLIPLFLLLFFFSIGAGYAQTNDSLTIDSLNLTRMRINKVGMVTLGGWAIGNMTAGSIQYFRTEGPEKYYHQMNAMWNIVNLAIAIPGFIGSRRSKAVGLDLETSLKQQKGNLKSFLINAGVDVAYIGTGVFLEQFSPRMPTEQWQDIFQGWGQSIIVQGSFLMIFDLGMYLMLKKHADGGLNKLRNRIGPASSGLGVQLKF